MYVTLRIIENKSSHKRREDVMMYVETAAGKPRRIVLFENVPTFQAECALRGARKALEAIGHEVGEM